MLQGNSTTEIAQGLLMSTGTVQQHLKSSLTRPACVSLLDLALKGLLYSLLAPRPETTNVAPAKPASAGGRSRLMSWRVASLSSAAGQG